MSAHTPEPWGIHKGYSGYAQFPADVVIVSAADEEWCVAIAIGDVRAVPSEANAARIVACVNALRGFDDPAAFVAAAAQARNDAILLTAERDALRAERDAIAAELEYAIDQMLRHDFGTLSVVPRLRAALARSAS